VRQRKGIMDETIELNQLSATARRGGLVLMSICIALAFFLAGWVAWHRKSRVVAALQPTFLLVLLVGIIITLLAIIPLGVDDSSFSKPQAACNAYPWLNNLGSTIIMTALLCKLKRVNRIFHAGRFQRAVVKAKDVMLPFAILIGLNFVLLTISTAIEPLVWTREAINGDENNTVGFCEYQSVFGEGMAALQAFVSFVALIIVCVQAYKAWDIRTEFSDARGIVLALFSMLQAIIITAPVEALIEESNTTALYVQLVVLEVTTSLATMVFIFLPVIHQHWKSQKNSRDGGNGGSHCVQGPGPRVTGLSNDATDSRDDTNLGIASELEAARIRIEQLEARIEALQKDPVSEPRDVERGDG